MTTQISAWPITWQLGKHTGKSNKEALGGERGLQAAVIGGERGEWCIGLCDLLLHSGWKCHQSRLLSQWSEKIPNSTVDYLRNPDEEIKDDEPVSTQCELERALRMDGKVFVGNTYAFLYAMWYRSVDGGQTLPGAAGGVVVGGRPWGYFARECGVNTSERGGEGW